MIFFFALIVLMRQITFWREKNFLEVFKAISPFMSKTFYFGRIILVY